MSDLPPIKYPKILARDKKLFIKALTDYYQYYIQLTNKKALLAAEKSYDNLIRGLNKDGGVLSNTDLQYFDEVLRVETDNMYIPSDAHAGRYKKTHPAQFTRKQNKNINDNSPNKQTSAPINDDAELEKEVARVKMNLISEYPSLGRKDMESNLESYARVTALVLRGTKNLGTNSKELKELVETQIKLGTFLGINESEKAKEKAAEDRQSIAAMSVEFFKSIEEIPNFRERLLFKELRMWLSKLDRQEISKKLFELPSYAGMSVQDARDFVQKNKATYEN